MLRPGRELELVVTRLESVLAQWPVTITSPDYITGRTSRTPREVDVSVRGRVGSNEILVILECRDRRNVEDVRWIDELISKRDDVGANLALAVSSTGFSSGARNRAQSSDIRLRTIEQFTSAEVLTWLGVNSLAVRRGQFKREVVDIAIPEGTSEKCLDGAPTVVAPDWPMLVTVNSGERLSVEDIYRWLDLGEAFQDLARSGRTSRRASLYVDFPDRDVALILDDDDVQIPVYRVIIHGEFSIELSEAPLTAIYRYWGSDDLLAEAVEADVDLNGVHVALALYRCDNDDGTQTLKGVAFTRDGQPVPDLDVWTTVELGGETVKVRGKHRGDLARH